MTEIQFNPEISPCLWGTPAGAPTPLSCQSQAPAAPRWILCMQRGVGGDQGVTKAGGQVTNLSVPFRGGLEQWGVHGGKNHLSRSLSNPAKPCIVQSKYLMGKGFHQQFWALGVLLDTLNPFSFM